jgi:hypothetical protein
MWIWICSYLDDGDFGLYSCFSTLTANASVTETSSRTVFSLYHLAISNDRDHPGCKSAIDYGASVCTKNGLDRHSCANVSDAASDDCLVIETANENVPFA